MKKISDIILFVGLFQLFAFGMIYEGWKGYDFPGVAVACIGFLLFITQAYALVVIYLLRTEVEKYQRQATERAMNSWNSPSYDEEEARG